MDTNIFFIILGLGVAIPFSIVLLINLSLKIVLGGSYEVELKKVGIVYLVALLGWSTFFATFLN
jgi:hypothetical protein